MSDLYLVHSAKGTQWKNHKYIKKVGNKYYYTVEQLNKDGKKETKDSEINAATTDADLIRNALGDKYDEIQKKVVEMQKKVGRTDLNENEIREILGDDYDDIHDKMFNQATLRNELKEQEDTKKNTKTSSSSKSSKSSKSSSSKSSSSEQTTKSQTSKTSQTSTQKTAQNNTTSKKSETKKATKTTEKKSVSKSAAEQTVKSFKEKYKVQIKNNDLKSINSAEKQKYYNALWTLHRKKDI